MYVWWRCFFSRTISCEDKNCSSLQTNNWKWTTPTKKPNGRSNLGKPWFFYSMRCDGEPFYVEAKKSNPPPNMILAIKNTFLFYFFINIPCTIWHDYFAKNVGFDVSSHNVLRKNACFEFYVKRIFKILILWNKLRHLYIFYMCVFLWIHL